MSDSINPDHYRNGPFECIELARLLSFEWGNVVKYCFRWKGKNGVEDLDKAVWYAKDAIMHGVPLTDEGHRDGGGRPAIHARRSGLGRPERRMGCHGRRMQAACPDHPHTQNRRNRKRTDEGGIMRRIVQTIRQILIIPALLSIYLALAIIEHRERRRGRK